MPAVDSPLPERPTVTAPDPPLVRDERLVPCPALGSTSWSNRGTPSRRWISRPGPRSLDWWSATTGIFGGCWCMGFHPKESWTDVAQKRAAKEQRVREGKAHAALVFDGEDCVGWCQVGAPGEVPRIKNRAAYEKGRTTSPDWRIACCYVGKGLRRQGVATAALAGALDLIADLGGGTVEGYPEDASSVPPASPTTAPCRPTRSSGSSVTARSASTAGVVTKVVEPRS
jgi:hypothetical protein